VDQAAGARDLRVQVIRPTKGRASLQLRELWEHRELLFAFTLRNVLVRYKQTLLGISWAILQPFFLMVVFTLFFRRVGNVDSGRLPYPIFSYSALLPWFLFANSLTQSANSLVANQNLLRKIYFPRLVLPITTILTALVDFLVASVVLGGMMVYYGHYPDPLRLLLIPAFLALALATALGVGLWLSALNVAYRDVQYVVPFLSQLWLFATPGIYLEPDLSQPWRTILGLNPMEGVVEGFRWALLDAGSAPGWLVLVSAGIASLLLASGAIYFRRMERTFADVV
jgi:homopolymeric O-antigen transport system permease protein